MPSSFSQVLPEATRARASSAEHMSPSPQTTHASISGAAYSHKYKAIRYVPRMEFACDFLFLNGLLNPHFTSVASIVVYGAPHLSNDAFVM